MRRGTSAESRGVPRTPVTPRNWHTEARQSGVSLGTRRGSLPSSRGPQHPSWTGPAPAQGLGAFGTPCRLAGAKTPPVRFHYNWWYGRGQSAPAAVSGWVLTDRHDLVPCAANSLYRATISVNNVIGGMGTLGILECNDRRKNLNNELNTFEPVGNPAKSPTQQPKN